MDNKVIKTLIKAVSELKPDKPHPRHKVPRKQIQKLKRIQKGKCPICHRVSKEESLMLDHSHNTGKVRGLVCGKCNWLIGYIKEDIPLLKRLLEHLDRGT